MSYVDLASLERTRTYICPMKEVRAHMKDLIRLIMSCTLAIPDLFRAPLGFYKFDACSRKVTPESSRISDGLFSRSSGYWSFFYLQSDPGKCYDVGICTFWCAAPGARK